MGPPAPQTPSPPSPGPQPPASRGVPPRAGVGAEGWKQIQGARGARGAAEIWGKAGSPGPHVSRDPPEAVHSAPPPPRRAVLAARFHPSRNTPLVELGLGGAPPNVPPCRRRGSPGWLCSRASSLGRRERRPARPAVAVDPETVTCWTVPIGNHHHVLLGITKGLEEGQPPPDLDPSLLEGSDPSPPAAGSCTARGTVPKAPVVRVRLQGREEALDWGSPPCHLLLRARRDSQRADCCCSPRCARQVGVRAWPAAFGYLTVWLAGAPLLEVRLPPGPVRPPPPAATPR